ncbi:MAG: acetylornithine deacetylase [Burkholderiaceae bacterium]
MENTDATALLRRLVAFDTVSSRPNLPLIEWSADLLDQAGFRTSIHRAADGEHGNLFATIGPEDVAGVMLSGHSDVVPVEGQPWTSDPFVLTDNGDRLVGRGSADMKGFIACMLASAPMLAASKLRQPVHIALSYNEETDMAGMREMAGQLAQAPVRPAACVIGEPTLMQVIVANKGAAIFRCRIEGFPAHSSLRDQGVSAVEIAAEMIAWLNRRQQQLNQAERHDGFEYPFSSIHAGMIRGGTAHNITAQHCEFVFEVRALPGVSAQAVVDQLQAFCNESLLPGMKAISADCAIAIEPIVNAPGLDERGNTHLARAIMPLCLCHSPGRVSFGTEAGFLTEVGVPTVVCGPGSILVAHQPDEYVERDQLDQCMRFIGALGRRLTDGALL